MSEETELIAGKCPFCGEEIIGDLEGHQYHGDDTMPCPKCGKWLTVHLIARFVVTADKEMQDYDDREKANEEEKKRSSDSELEQNV